MSERPSTRAASGAHRAVRLTLFGVVVSTIAGCTNWKPERRTPLSRELLRTAPTLVLEPATTPATRPTTTRPVATTGPVEVPLTLADARARVLRFNLELSAALLDPSIAAEALSVEEAAFDAVFTTRVDYSTLDQPTASRLVGSQSDAFSIRPGLQFPLHTGGTITVEAPLSRSETNNQFSSLNPAYESDLALSVRQPLLRGAGRDVVDRRIRVAFYQQEQAEARTKLEAIRLIAAVDRAYWRLHAARQQLQVRLGELELANAQLERARRRVRAQQAAEVEILRAESGAADQLEQVIVAENDVRQRQRELKRLINDATLPMNEDTIVVPTSPPATMALALDQAALVERAIAQRAELLDIELDIIQRTLDVNVARNDLLPLVTLDYTYNINGLGPSVDDSISLATDRDYQDHRVGLQVEIPIGNRAARAGYRRALLQRLRTLADRDVRAQQVRQEVLNAVDQIRTNLQRVEAARQRVSLNRRLVDAEIRQFNQGLRTSTEVLETQNRLADAESSLVAAEAEYQIAQTDLAFATGTTLGAARISWSPPHGPR